MSRRSTRIAALLLGVLAALMLAAPAGAQVPPSPPATPAGAQLAWLLDASRRPPVAEAELRSRLAPEFAALLTADAFNQGLAASAGPAGFTLESIRLGTPTRIVAVAAGSGGRFEIALEVDAQGLIAGLALQPYVPPPVSWAELDARLRRVAPHVSFLAAEGAACRPVHALAPRVSRPLGSAFKLYVLGALAQAVRAGRARWDEPLPIRDEWKSLPSGRLQDEPAGTSVTLAEHAALMISISDNTATDHLIRRLGRRAVERQLERFRHADPAVNRPFLTTRELFAIKGTTRARRRAYARLVARGERGEAARRAFLAGDVARVPLAAIEPWTQPRAIRTVEWFASGLDLCRAYAGLARQGEPPAARALSINDGALALDPAAFPEVWFKGGSEPGVLVLAYRVRAADGRVLTLALMASDPARPLGAEAAGELVALARGAVALA